LAYLGLECNDIGYTGTLSLARVLPHCQALSHVNLKENHIGADGAEVLAEVLGQCTALVELNLSQNGIGTAGKERLRSSWCGPASGLEWTGTWDPFGSDSSDDEDVQIEHPGQEVCARELGNAAGLG
jgi:hypothetical protein